MILREYKQYILMTPKTVVMSAEDEVGKLYEECMH